MISTLIQITTTLFPYLGGGLGSFLIKQCVFLLNTYAHPTLIKGIKFLSMEGHQ